MALHPNRRDVELGYDVSLSLPGIGKLKAASATLTSEFSTTVRQFELKSEFSQTAESNVVASLVNGSSIENLTSEFSISATNVFEGDIIRQFDMSASFGISVVYDRITPLSPTQLTGVFGKTQTPNLVSTVDSSVDAVFNQTAYPFGLFVDTDPTTITSNFLTHIDAERFDVGASEFKLKFNLNDGTEFIEGTNRKFTVAQIAAITSSSTQIVDFVELYVNYENVDLPIEDQIRIPPVLRWNSSGRDLEILDYKGNTQHYKGKNVMMRLPSFEYNGMFTKKTVKIQINGLLRYFNQAMVLGYLNYAPIVMGKAVYNYNGGSATQIDRAVLLQSGVINSFTLSGSPDQQSTTIEVDSGFYNYDRRVATRTNSASYEDYLYRMGDYTGLAVYDTNSKDVGKRIMDKIFWGADVVV